jgi:hypothetical protein
MLALLIVIGRALALALRGHRELVLENRALRQQLTVLRTTSRPHLATCDRLFGAAWPGSGRTGARRWCSCSRTPSCGGFGTGSAADGPDARNPARTAVHLSISRSASSSEKWRRRTRCGEHLGLMASCAHSVSTSQNARKGNIPSRLLTSSAMLDVHAFEAVGFRSCKLTIVGRHKRRTHDRLSGRHVQQIQA